jgi:hypothetical protein
MTSVVLAFGKKLLKYVVVVAAALATISGCVAAIQWGITAVGPIPIALIGMFVLGCILTAALIHARGSARSP